MLNLSKNGIIQVSRGDSFKLPLFINCGTPDKPIRYDLNLEKHKATIIYFSLTEPNQYFEQGVVRKLYNIALSALKHLRICSPKISFICS